MLRSGFPSPSNWTLRKRSHTLERPSARSSLARYLAACRFCGRGLANQTRIFAKRGEASTSSSLSPMAPPRISKPLQLWNREIRKNKSKDARIALKCRALTLSQKLTSRRSNSILKINSNSWSQSLIRKPSSLGKLRENTRSLRPSSRQDLEKGWPSTSLQI